MAGHWLAVLLIAVVLSVVNIAFVRTGVKRLAVGCAPAGDPGAGTLCEHLQHLSAYMPGPLQGFLRDTLRSSAHTSSSTDMQQELMAAEDPYWTGGRAQRDRPRGADGEGGCEVFVGIFSRPEAKAARDAMRRTWLRDIVTTTTDAERRQQAKEQRIQYKFFIGRQPRTGSSSAQEGGGILAVSDDHVLVENNDDVVRLPFIDTYYNLSIKTAHVLRWSESRDLGCRWVVKCDDDVYVHLPALQETLASLPDPSWPVYAGHILTEQAPVRDPSSKWYLPTRAYDQEFFPPYAEGPIYIMSAGLAQDLPFQLQEHGQEVVPSTFFQRGPRSSLFRFEDVFTGELILRTPYRPSVVHLPAIYVHANHTRPAGSSSSGSSLANDDDDVPPPSSSSSANSEEAKDKKAVITSSSDKDNDKDVAMGGSSGATAGEARRRRRGRRRVAAVHGLGPGDMTRMHLMVNHLGDLPVVAPPSASRASSSRSEG